MDNKYFYLDGFYCSEIHGDSIPDGSVEISEIEYKDLLNGQSTGKEIIAGQNGKPELSAAKKGGTSGVAQLIMEQIEDWRNDVFTYIKNADSDATAGKRPAITRDGILKETPVMDLSKTNR